MEQTCYEIVGHGELFIVYPWYIYKKAPWQLIQLHCKTLRDFNHLPYLGGLTDLFSRTWENDPIWLKLRNKWIVNTLFGELTSFHSQDGQTFFWDEALGLVWGVFFNQGKRPSNHHLVGSFVFSNHLIYKQISEHCFSFFSGKKMANLRHQNFRRFRFGNGWHNNIRCCCQQDAPLQVYC